MKARTLAAAALVIAATLAGAHAAEILGSASGFAVLPGSTVTNTGTFVITRDVEGSPSSAIMGFPSEMVTGTIHAAEEVTAQAQSDLTAAYTSLAPMTPSANLSGIGLAGSCSLPVSIGSTRPRSQRAV